MNRRVLRTRTPRRLGAVRAVLSATLLLLAGCGLPGDTDVRVIDDASVPYRLLDPEPGSRPGRTGPVPSGTPVVFWLMNDDRLAPTAVSASCTDPLEEVASRLLTTLAAAPDDVARSAGRSSAIPPSSALDLVEVVDGVALVALDPATSLTADRLPLALGQLVLTITSAPGIEAVRVAASGDTVEVPLPGGALTDRPVTGDDYAPLLLDRFRADGAPGVSPDLGCPDPGAEGG